SCWSTYSARPVASSWMAGRYMACSFSRRRGGRVPPSSTTLPGIADKYGHQWVEDGGMAETTARVLRLLGRFATRSVSTGPELGEGLGVTSRARGRDVDRLRALGYPVEAARGVGGGYRLGAGGRMAPLLLEEGEVVAVTVALRAGAQGISAIGEPAVRAVTKL